MQGLEKAQRQYDRQEPNSPCRSEGREYSAPEIPPPGAQITRSVLFINPREGRMAPKYTTGLMVRVDTTLGVPATDEAEYRCIGFACGWNDDEVRDDAGKIVVLATPTDEAIANAQLWAAAAELVAALKALMTAADNLDGDLQGVSGLGALESAVANADAALTKAGAA